MQRSIGPRAFSLFAITILLLAGFPSPNAMGTANAGLVLFEETWDIPNTAWTYTGLLAGQECPPKPAYAGCSLVIDAQFNDQAVKAERTLDLSIASPGYVVSFYFRNDWVASTSKSSFSMAFAGNDFIKLDLTHGEPHNRLRLYTSTDATAPFHTYSAKTWYQAVIKVDLVNHLVRVEVRDPATAAILSNSSSLALPPSAAHVESVVFDGYYYGTSLISQPPRAMNYDVLRFTTPEPPTAPLALSAVSGPGVGEIQLDWQPPADDGGVPVLYHLVYGGNTSGSAMTLIANTTSLTFTESALGDGRTRHYAVKAVNAMGESAASSQASATTFDRPTVPRNLAANPGSNVGEIRLTWQAPASNGGTPITNYIIYRGNASGTQTFLTEVGDVRSYTDVHRPDGTRWYYNVTAVNFMGEGPSSNEASSLPRPDRATTPIGILITPDPWWSDQPRTVQFGYSVTNSECEPTQACPVAHEWRIYQGGTDTGLDGLLLANGTNTHEGHAQLVAYNMDTEIVPTGLDGTHKLKIAVNPRIGNPQWSVGTTSFQIGIPQPDPTCNSNPGFYTYVMPGVAAPNQTARNYAKTYGYALNGETSPYRAVFQDGCPTNGPLGPGDGFYEIGYGGILLDGSAAGTMIQLPDSTGNPPSFVIGTDLDGSGIIGDSALDCIQGPHVLFANITCAADTTGHIVLLFIPSSPDASPHDVPLWGRGQTCVPVVGKCFVHEYYVVPPDLSLPRYQEDKDRDKMGDAWQQSANSAAKNVDRILNAIMDQEFDTPCGTDCLNTPRSGDGLSNVNEFRWRTIPIGPLWYCPPKLPNGVQPDCVILFPNARDFDQDNWEDGPEHDYWNNPENDPVIHDDAWTLISTAPSDPDSYEDIDRDGLGPLHDDDSDNDTLLDGDEWYWGSYPEYEDSDCAEPQGPCDRPPANRFELNRSGTPGVGDGIKDGEELAAWRQWDVPWRLEAAKIDHDYDGIPNNLLDPDSDGDGILDGFEFKCIIACTNASMFDTDGDGLLDGHDVVLLQTDPRTPHWRQAGIIHEATGTGYRFFGEIDANTDPLDWDTDGDCLPDGWEVKFGLQPTNPLDADLDADQDGLTNRQEYDHARPTTACSLPTWWGGTDPTRPDTDNDGLTDGAEVHIHNTNPLQSDTDLDGLTDGAEVHVHGTNPLVKDTDEDGLTDYQEVVTYAHLGPNPLMKNTDGSGNQTNDDTLTDYQEIIQYGTKPNHWDSDNDGMADGRDSHPLRYDSPPTRTDLVPIEGVRPNVDSYAVFRENGYVDVIVQDIHGNEAEIQAVDVRVRLNGIVVGQSSYSVVYQEAQRLDDGSTWGARIGLPEKMSRSTSQTYIVTVVSSGGNVASYTGSSTTSMSSVAWAADRDVVDPDGWSRLMVHESAGQTPAASMMTSQPVIDPYSLSLDELFALVGNFSVYRLKPFAIEAADVPDVLNASAFSILRPISIVTDDPANTTLIDSIGWNVTVWEDAFAYVDPLEELGLYQSLAMGGPSSFRTPKWLREGMRTAWKYGESTAGWVSEEAVAQGASFVFGSDDPRAKGRMTGDIVAGILVYGDARDIVVGTVQRDALKASLGAIGIGLTFVGPGADGPYSAFKSGVKLIASAPVVGPRVAVKLADDLKDLIKVAREAGDGPAALRFVVGQGDLALWASRNTDKLADFERVQNAIPITTLHALTRSLDNVVGLSADLARVTDEATAQAILKRFTEPSAMYPQGGAEALAEVADVVKVVRDSALASGRPVTTAGQLGSDLDVLRNAPNVNQWWHNRAKNHIKAPGNDGWFGYVFEAEQGARLQKGGVLGVLDEQLKDVIVGDNPARIVQVDMFRVAGGKNILTDAKSGATTGATVANREQMEAQAAAVLKHEVGENLVREIHWVVEGRVTEPLAQHAADIYGNYGVQVKFFNRQGNQIMNFFPE